VKQVSKQAVLELLDPKDGDAAMCTEVFRFSK